MNNTDIINQIKEGIAKTESGGKYTAIGPVTKSGDRAYGKYQIMGNNIPSWTKEALGKSYTPNEFMNDTDAQEKVASYKMGQYYNKYGNPQDVASTWFTGGPMKTGAGKKDVLGTTTEDYVQKSTGGLLNNLLGIKTANAQTKMQDQPQGSPQSAPQTNQPTGQRKQLTRDQLIQNIDAMTKQGAPRQVIQSYLDSLKGGSSGGRKTFTDELGSATIQTPQDTTPENPSNLDKFGNGLSKIGTSETGQGIKDMVGAVTGSIGDAIQGDGPVKWQNPFNASNYKDWLDNPITNDIRRAGSVLTFGGTEAMGNETGKALNYGYQTAKDTVTGSNNAQYSEAPDVGNEISGSGRTLAGVATLAAGGSGLLKTVLGKALPTEAVEALGGSENVSKTTPQEIVKRLEALFKSGKLDIRDMPKAYEAALRAAGYAPSIIKSVLSKILGVGGKAIWGAAKVAIPYAGAASIFGNNQNRKE